ncbi:hypothetical protein [Enterobacter kobei]
MSNIDKQGRQVQRYTNFGVDMMEWADGGYVKHSDYQALLDDLEAKDNRINRLEAIVAVAEQRNALMREWKRALKVPCDLVDDQVPVVIHGMVIRLERIKETEAKLEAAEKRIAEFEAREAEPVAYADPQAFENFKSMGGKNAACTKEWMWRDSCQGLIPLFTTPPAPESVPGNSAITQHFDTIALDTAREIMCDVNRRHEFLGGEVQLLSRIQCRIDDACRAAMLQGDEPVTTACKLPVETGSGGSSRT